ncbi:MAG: hypothetical protein QNJ13_13445 [Paracoccaceae bacterium]|nr:hypothetical protein [Paracoccaceae bacterium]
MSPKATLATVIMAAALVVGSALPAAADVPTYRHKSDVPASMSDRLKLASRYVGTPGRTLRAPSGPVVARQVVIGNSRFIVFSNAGRNSVRDIAETARRYTDCSVARNASFRTIRTNSIVPTGYAMPCSG